MLNFEAAKKLVPSVLFHVSDEVATSALGCWITTSTNRRLLDFAAGIGMLSTGHSHPRVVAAIRDQAGKYLHPQINCIWYDKYLETVSALHAALPGAGAHYDSIVLNTTGAEAIEGAIKLARHVTKRPNVIAFQGGFHGRTGWATALTSSKAVYRAGYQPLPSGAFISPFPYCYRCRERSAGNRDVPAQGCCLGSVEDLKLLLKTQSAPSETAALLIEPILGEGGYVAAPRAFLKALREVCDEHGMLLIFDEVQSGFGRTGSMFAYEAASFASRANAAPDAGELKSAGELKEFHPDILVMAKGIASGLPLSALATKAKYTAVWGPPGAHGGTYTGSPIACAAAIATMSVIKEEKLAENAVKRGEQMIKILRERIAPKVGVIGDIRGRGLMIGVEFAGVKSGFAGAVVKQAEKLGLLLLSCGPYDTIRLIPPLVVSEKEVVQAMDLFEKAIIEAKSSF